MKNACALSVMLLAASYGYALAQGDPPIATPLDRWQPILPGNWAVTSTMSEPQAAGPSPQATISACPFPAMLFLGSMARIKIGEAGCLPETRQLSGAAYHIATQCMTLGGKNHIETTTLVVADGGRKFTAVTTWTEREIIVSLRREGEFQSACDGK